MTSSEDLSPEAKHLLARARGADRATRSEITGSVQRFQKSSTPGARERGRAPLGFRSPGRRATPWAVFAAILSGTLGAYATVGQSLGLPVPGWWMEFTALPTQVDTATNRFPAKSAQGSDNGGTPHVNALGGPAMTDAPVPNAALSIDAVSTGAPPIATLEPGAQPDSTDVMNPTRVARTTATRSSKAPTDKPQPVTTPAESAQGEAHSGEPEPISASALSREVQSITAARDALAAGNYVAAERHLDEHRAQFPRGALSAERQALSMICQCRSGRGTAAAAAYVGRRPTTPLARRVATECGLTLPNEEP